MENTVANTNITTNNDDESTTAAATSIIANTPIADLTTSI